MILKKIRLKNFLSYGNKTQEINLDYRGIICLAGNNGNGKSALLDAITWALWGMARRSQGLTKSDDLVMHLGATCMFVTVEFESHNTQYMVTRSCEKKTTRLQSELTCFIFDTESQSYKNISVSSIKAAQELINSILGITYDTFINTVFLRQGLSNEFSKKTPKERKELLIEILNINRIELLREKITEDIKRLTIEKTVIEKSLLNLPHVLTEPEIQELYNSVKEQQKIYKIKLELYNNKKKELESLQNQYKQYTDELLLISQEELMLQKKHHEYTTIYDQIKKEYNSFKKAHAYKNTHNVLSPENLNVLYVDMRNTQDHLERYKLQYMSLYEKNKTEHTIELNSISTQLNTNKQLLISIENKEQAYKKIIESFSKNELEKAEYAKKITLQKKNELEKKHAFYKNILQSIDIFIKNKINKQKELDHICFLLNNNPQSECFVCNNPLKKEKKDELLNDKKNIHTQLTHRIEKLRTQNTVINTYVTQCTHIIKQLTHDHKTYDTLCSQLTLKMTEATKAQDDLAALITEKSELQIIIAKLQLQESSFKEEYNGKNNVLKVEYEESIKLLQQSYQHHESQYAIAKKHHEHYQMLISNLSSPICISKIRSGLLNIINNIKKSNTENQTIQNKKKEISAALQTNSIQKMQETVNIDEHELQELYTKLTEQSAQYKITQEQHTNITAKRNELTNNFKKLDETIIVRSELALLLDKDHLQGAIIEEVLPFIEQEANDMLLKLSQGTSTISIESVRDLKSGKTKDTLDILITDAYGTRPYEFFSGGESFRIDLALRIALAKLLMQQTGNNIKTLIIDEGFGSQDAVALDVVIECLNSLQNEFDTIFLVSHLPSMKDMFAVQLLINKTMGGSFVSVVK